jgi:hypothetical protein
MVTTIGYFEKVQRPKNELKQNRKCPNKIQPQYFSLVPYQHAEQEHNWYQHFQSQSVWIVWCAVQTIIPCYSIYLSTEECGCNGMENRPSTYGIEDGL